MTNIPFTKGQRVWWNDPFDNNSGYRTILSDVQEHIRENIQWFGEQSLLEDGLVILVSDDAGNKSEVYAHELNYVYEGNYRKLGVRQECLHRDMESYIHQRLHENEGRITLEIDEEERLSCDSDDQIYPIITTLYGKHGDNYNIGITDIYLKSGNQIYADGYDTMNGGFEIGFAVTRDQYYDVAFFIASVLGIVE